MRTRLGFLTALSTLALAAICPQSQAAEGIGKIDHILVIYMENRSFDNLYGLFPGANGLAQAGDMATQVDKDGKPYQALPTVMDTNKKPAAAMPSAFGKKPNRLSKL